MSRFGKKGQYYEDIPQQIPKYRRERRRGKIRKHIHKENRSIDRDLLNGKLKLLPGDMALMSE